MKLYWTSSHLTELTQLNTKHIVDSSTMHSHPFNAMSPCICNAPLHVISCHMYNDCYIYNTIHTTYRVSWTITSPAYDFLTLLHSCQYIMQAYINIHIQHVILSQVMTHTQSSLVMVICTYKLITCQYIRTHILTFKHVILSQAITLSNKSYNGPEASHKQLQIGLQNQPQIGHEHMPQIVIGSPRRSLPSPK